MFEKLNYKRKNWILLAGFLLFSIIIYQVSILETLQKKETYDALVEQSGQLENAPELIAGLKGELQSLDELIGYIRSDSMDTQQLILERVTNYGKANGIELKKFLKPQLDNEINYQVETIKFVVEGNFIPLLKLVHAFEQKFALGKVVSVDFSIEKELRSQRDKLYATIFIQNIKKP